MAELHSITGLFYEAFPGISAWGGYFLRLHDGGERIEGHLIDDWGPSKIEGMISPEVLKFRKEYVRCNNNLVWDYEFSSKNDMWFGKYSYPNGKYGGNAVCKTGLCVPDLNFERVDLNNPEVFATKMIEGMINKGLLESVKDPETGEDLIRPVGDM